MEMANCSVSRSLGSGHDVGPARCPSDQQVFVDGLAGLSICRRDLLGSLGGLVATAFLSEMRLSDGSENATSHSRYPLSFFMLPTQGEAPPFPPEWGPVAREILEFYPTNPKGNKDMATARDIVRAQNEVMRKLDIRAVSNAAHELTHMLNSQAEDLWGGLPQFANPRDEREGNLIVHWNDVQGVYLGEGRFAFVDHPAGVTAQMIRDKVPASAKTWGRYQRYLIAAMSPGSYHRSGYVLNELSAYCSSARTETLCYDHFVASNLSRRDGKTRISNGHEEMAVFVLALAMAADRAPHAFRNEERKEQFMAVVAALVEKAVHLESQLSDEMRFPAYGKVANPRISLRELLRTNSDFAEMREWIDRKYGAAWYNSLFNQDKPGVDTSRWQIAFHEGVE